MARMPDADWRPIPENSSQRKIIPTQCILHSAVGKGSLFGYFSRTSVVVESHFWVGLNGEIEQYLDTEVRGDANYLANPRAISIETADNGSPDTFEWTPAQLASIVKILLWVHKTHDIPLVQTPAWDAPGIGYHTMWGAPGRWTPVAKSCPGRARIRQFPAVLATAVALDTPPVVPVKPKPPTPTPPKPTPAPTLNWSEKLVKELPTLQFDDKGVDVKRLQGLLIAANVVATSVRGNYVDGDFGRATRGDVVEFQGKKGLKQDGVVGEKTWTALLD